MLTDCVMLSGHFDPFTDAHLDYIEQAMAFNKFLFVMVSSDKQLLMKKGKVNIPQEARLRIVYLILRGLGDRYDLAINQWDTDTPLVAEALKVLKPIIFFRGGDKTLDAMPPEERKVCEELGIKIVHAKFRIDRHGRDMIL